MLRICFSCFHFGHRREFAEWVSLQFMQFSGEVHTLKVCPVWPQREQVSFPLHLLVEWPNFWHLKQRKGFGMYGRTLQIRYPALISVGNVAVLKVNTICWVGIMSAPFLMVICLASITPWLARPSRISEASRDWGVLSEITPFDMFSVLWLLWCW